MRLFAGTKFDQPPKCDRCGKLEAECVCPPLAKDAAAGKAARLSVEKRKKGKVVTVIRGLAASGNDLPALLTRLKSLCGAGGAIQEDCLEVQGNHVERISAALSDLGYQIKS